MKYTKAFEKYWLNAKCKDGVYKFEDTKRVAFLAWKAGIKRGIERERSWYERF